MKTRFLVLFLFGLLLVGSAFGQGVQTSTLEGTVTGPDGVVLPGVSVTVTSPALMGERQTVTSSTGEYLLRGLPPGTYTVRFALEGMRAPNQKIVLLLGSNSRVDAAMKVSTVSEAITVTASSPTVLENVSGGQNLKSDVVQQLPVVRTPVGIGSLSPGVTGDRGGRDGTPVGGQLSMSGGMAYDNALLINGVNFADVVFGQANNLFIEDAIQETQVLTSGISAEYGHFTGGVLNVITKSGGNQLTGSLRGNLSNPKWLALTPYEQGYRGEGVTRGKEAPHQDKLGKVYELTLGGPIIRDRLWFFVAGRDEKSATAGTTPVTGYAYTVNQANRRPEYKLTGNVASNHTLQFDWINNPVTRDNEVQVSPIDLTAISKNSKRENRGWVANYQGVLTTNLFAEARYSKKIYTFLGLGGTSTNIIDSPFRAQSSFPGVTAGTFNAPYFDATDPDGRNNKTAYAALSYFLSKPSFGTHDIKGGFEQFTDTRLGGNSQSSTGYVFYTGYANNNGTPILDANGHLIPTFNPYDGTNADYTVMVNWLATRGAKIDTTTDTFFVNDRWSLNSYLSFNIGLRHESVKSKATGGIVSVDTSNTVPRLAASYDPQGNGKYKFDVTYAGYAGHYNSNLTGANTPVGNPADLDGYYIGPAGQGRDFAPGFDPKNYVFYYAGVPTANVFVEKGLHTPINKEWSLSGGMQLPKGGWVKASFTDRKYTDFINSEVTINQGCSEISLGGVDMGCFDNIYYRNTNGPKRHYQAADIQSHYELTRAWAIDGNWTHQLKNDGNYEGESGQSITTSAYNNYPEMTSPRQFPTGRLSQYQKDKIRLWSTYNFDLRRFGNLSAGLIYRYDSPLTFSYAASSVSRSAIAKAKDPGYKNPPPSITLYFGDRGAGQFNSSSLFDASLQYSLPISKVTPWVKVDVRNILNTDTQLTWNTTVTPDKTSPKDDWGYYTKYTKSATFGRPTSANSYVRPREVLLYLGVRF